MIHQLSLSSTDVEDFAGAIASASGVTVAQQAAAKSGAASNQSLRENSVAWISWGGQEEHGMYNYINRGGTIYIYIVRITIYTSTNVHYILYSYRTHGHPDSTKPGGTLESMGLLRNISIFYGVPEAIKTSGRNSGSLFLELY